MQSAACVGRAASPRRVCGGPRWACGRPRRAWGGPRPACRGPSQAVSPSRTSGRAGSLHLLSAALPGGQLSDLVAMELQWNASLRQARSRIKHYAPEEPATQCEGTCLRDRNDSICKGDTVSSRRCKTSTTATGAMECRKISCRNDVNRMSMSILWSGRVLGNGRQTQCCQR
jgi:hypothetical protein